jgi:hypothetical protein
VVSATGSELLPLPCRRFILDHLTLAPTIGICRWASSYTRASAASLPQKLYDSHGALSLSACLDWDNLRHVCSTARLSAVYHTATRPRAPTFERSTPPVHPGSIPTTTATLCEQSTTVQPPPGHSGLPACLSAGKRATFQRRYEQRPWLSSTRCRRKREGDIIELNCARICHQYAATPNPDQCATICAVITAAFTVQHPPQPFA